MMRRVISVSIGLAAGIFAFSAGAGLLHSLVWAAVIGIVTAACVGVLLLSRAILPMDESISRGLKGIALLSTVLALLMLGRIAVFMVDSSQVQYSLVPTSDWEVRHSCFSAYFVAGQRAAMGNIYDDSLYSVPDTNPTGPRTPRRIGPFKVDVFEYPPPFLLLPRALQWMTPGFADLRAVWFGLNGALILLAILAIARFLGPAIGTRALLLSPLIWLSFPTLSTLQKGNVQAMVIAASMLAMALFERRKFAIGGSLLAFATVSKLYPGMLVLYLIARREWRAAAWTAAFGIGFCALSFVDLGQAPFAAFLQHLPGLLGGESFPAFRNPLALAINHSIPGLVFKLKLFGVPGMSFAAAKTVGWIYTLVVVAAVLLAAQRAPRDEEKPLIWIAILIAATLRSPFLPQAYAAFPSLWLLTLLAANRPATAKSLAAAILVWAALNIFWPLDWKMDPRWLAILSFVPQMVTAALAFVVLRPAVESNVEPIPSVAPA